MSNVVKLKFSCSSCDLEHECDHKIVPSESGNCIYFVHKSSPPEWRSKQRLNMITNKVKVNSP
jgi:hypothetical protein